MHDKLFLTIKDRVLYVFFHQKKALEILLKWFLFNKKVPFVLEIFWISSSLPLFFLSFAIAELIGEMHWWWILKFIYVPKLGFENIVSSISFEIKKAFYWNLKLIEYYIKKILMEKIFRMTTTLIVYLEIIMTTLGKDSLAYSMLIAARDSEVTRSFVSRLCSKTWLSTLIGFQLENLWPVV